MSVAKLSSRVRRDLTYLTEPSREWTAPRYRDGAAAVDVLVVGAGQGGLAVAFGLSRERITNIRIVDRSTRGAEGPWRRFARMKGLRTRKDAGCIDFGVPSLTLRAYYEARFGRRAWELCEKVPPTVWRDYLDWYRDVLELPVENDTELVCVEGDGDTLLATLRRPAGLERVRARKIVLATGIDGSGIWRTPPALVAHIPAARYAHSADEIDFRLLKGKRVAILGVGPSALDNAAAALEAGAAQVDLCFRRKDIPRVNPLIWMYFSGMLAHFGELSELDRWRFMRRILVELPPAPPQDVFWRCRRHDNFNWHADCVWHSVREEGDSVVIESSTSRYEVDFIIFATGFDTDLTARPELSKIVQHIALWRDRFTPPPGEANDLLGRHPYLGNAFEFTERVPGNAPYLARLHNFTFGAMLSHGVTGAAVTGMKYGVPRLVGGLVRDLFREDADTYYSKLLEYAEPELETLDSPADWIKRLATDALNVSTAEGEDGLASFITKSVGAARSEVPSPPQARNPRAVRRPPRAR
jgi:cation diffusion facilitator CzcD-associated flavoprotein CzcO